MARLSLLASAGAPEVCAQPTSHPPSSARCAPPTVAVSRRSPLRSEVAYQALLPELRALPAEHLRPVDVDVMSAVAVVADALPRLFELCADPGAPASEQRRRGQPELRVEQLERLEQCTLALSHAHLLYCGSCSPDFDVTLLAAELTKARDAMLAHAEALAAEGLLDGQRLRRIALRSALHSAHRALAGDVIALCAALRDHWPQLEHRTPYSLEEQHRLVRMALDLMAALDIREPATSDAAESSDVRQRAFTLFASAYEQLRATVRGLRAGAGDADVLAPSLLDERTRRSLTAAPPPASAAAAPPLRAPAASRALSHPTGTRD